MKFFYLSIFCACIALISSCILDREPTIPTGANNEEVPVFLSTDITAITNNSTRAKAKLNSLDNLNILYHGWAWSLKSNPTLQDSILELKELVIDNFENIITIPNLPLEDYYIRPYVLTATDTTYGPEKVATYKRQVTFFTKGTLACVPVTVNINGQTGQISSPYLGGFPPCGADGCATFTLLPGVYNFTANCGSLNWISDVQVYPRGCTVIYLSE